ncbi:MAG: hypothetical protein IKG59_04580 [Firmicutes bacterium]|nr:hypothetical protein [Eubacterium sp.]MBR3053388.1 hypothetical protein [Bacillota bacterium]
MVGYVTAFKDQLAPEEWDVYRGYYCGVCRSIGRRYGQLPRITLSYDAAFLALLLSSLAEEEDRIVMRHCIVHPVRKNPSAEGPCGPWLDYAGDMMLLMAYYNFLDDRKDEHRLRGAAGTALLKKAHSELLAKYPGACRETEEALAELGRLEAENAGSLDRTAETFGRILKAAFTAFSESSGEEFPAGKNVSKKDLRILAECGDALGRWIYMMDACDDFDKDAESGVYNPLRYRREGKDGLSDTLYAELGRLSAAVDLLDIAKNKGIIDNVILLGMRGRTEMVLAKLREPEASGEDGE